MKKWIIPLLCLISCTAFANNLVNTIKHIKPSVVGIGTHTPTGQPQNSLNGTGFVIGDGLTIVTNYHVVAKALDSQLLQKRAVFIGTGDTATVRIATLQASSEADDLAILKIKGQPLPALSLADESYRDEGTAIAFTGFPIGSILGLYPVTHHGIISAITPIVIPAVDSRQINIRMLKRMRDPYYVYQLDATAYPGNSGSAMFSIETGKVLGIINKVFVQSTKEAVIEKPSGITYAIPVIRLIKLLKKNDIPYS